MEPIISVEQIGRQIFLIRGQRVMLDSDLARLYGVSTARLNQQVKRNLGRFPGDFVFKLSSQEHRNLMLQFATSSSGYGGRRKEPFAFTEHGAIMLAAVLNSPVAVQASVRIVRAFVQLRNVFGANKKLAKRLAQLEFDVARQNGEIRSLFETIQGLSGVVEAEVNQWPRIGFRVKEAESKS